MSRPTASAVLLCLLSVTSFGSDPPPIKPVIVSRTVVPAAVGANPISLDLWETSQRYVALVPTTAEILTFDYSDPTVVEVLTRSPTEKFYGTSFDAPAGARCSDANFPNAKGMVAIVVGKNTGTCQVTVWGVKDGKAVKLDTVLINVAGGAPPGPVVPPQPVLTPFQVTLQNAYHVDVATKGATADSKSKYAALWRNAAKTTVYDTTIVTPAALMNEMNTAVKNLGIPPGSLDNTARAVANEINPLMPKPSDGAMSKAVRDSVSALFTRISQDLEVIK